MIKKIKTTLNNIYGHQLPIRQRFFNIIFVCGFLVGIMGVLACINLRSSQEAIMVSATMTFAFPLLAYIGIRSKHNQDRIINFALIVVNFFIFPSLYLTGGGIDCGIPSYFVFGIALTLFLTKGKASIILTAAECVFYIFVIYISYAFPFILADIPAYTLSPTGERDFTFNAISSNTAMVCVALGILAKIIFRMYQKESQVVSNSIIEVQRQTTIDPLTNVYNRRYMYTYLTEQVKKARINQMPLSVVLFDIDKFKNLNDTYGHVVGDKVLQAISRLIKDSCKDGEIVARYGGEEFLLILPNYDMEKAASRAEEIRYCIEKSYLMPELPTDKPVTISGGIATYDDTYDEEKLVAVADENLYKAKESGRNRICY